jgi:hypothetical protein
LKGEGRAWGGFPAIAFSILGNEGMFKFKTSQAKARIVPKWCEGPWAMRNKGFQKIERRQIVPCLLNYYRRNIKYNYLKNARSMLGAEAIQKSRRPDGLEITFPRGAAEDKVGHAQVF